MAFRRSTVRSRPSPPEENLEVPSTLRFSFFAIQALSQLISNTFLTPTMLVRKISGQHICHALFSFCIEMTVNVCGHLYIGASQPFLNAFQCKIRVNKKAVSRLSCRANGKPTWVIIQQESTDTTADSSLQMRVEQITQELKRLKEEK